MGKINAVLTLLTYDEGRKNTDCINKTSYNGKTVYIA